MNISVMSSPFKGRELARRFTVYTQERPEDAKAVTLGIVVENSVWPSAEKLRYEIAPTAQRRKMHRNS